MELNINSPAYYSDTWGIDNEIYSFCKMLSEYVKDKHYSNKINVIGITPIVAPKEILQMGLWKEVKKCEVRYGFASVSLQINFEEYAKAEVEEKKELMIQNVLNSVKCISKKGNIDYQLFENDVFEFCKKINLDMPI